MKTMTFRIFGTLYEISLKITKRLPKYATVRSNTPWIYKGETFKVHSLYSEARKNDPPGTGRYFRLSLKDTKFEFRDGARYSSTVIPEKDLICKY